MKKILSLVLAAVMLAGMMSALASCDTSTAPARRTLTVGVTQFQPMNFLDADGNWTGFDTEFALAVAEKLNMDVQFQQISWSQKFLELQSGAIDVIWNGMTANAIDSTTQRPRFEDVDFTYSYMLNHQAVVVRADMADELYANGLEGRTGSAEMGSPGESLAREAAGSGEFIGVPSQIDTFVEVMSGAVDFAVVDSILAYRMTGSGDFAALTVAYINIGSKQEVYAIGLPIGSPLVAQFNTAIMELWGDGTLLEIAAKYGLEDLLVVNTQPIRTMPQE
ncbi:MAG: transporter substrate-binding domain-containing protein [Oscillospiraceae bacterium]|nr:transporter substrate-binding domain-containing protein [Oscillospiraceae bacterium]